MSHRQRNNISLEVTQQEAPFSLVNALKVVQSPTSPDWVKTRRQGKTELSYVSGDVVIRLLNKAFNYRWSYEVLETRVVDSVDKFNEKYDKEPKPQTPVVQSLGRLTVPGWGVREQWGSQVVLASGADVQANAFKGAATDAMKKCASTFGIALDLYGQQGINELRVTPQDIMTDDDEILGKFGKKIEEDLKENEAKVTNHAPAEILPEDLEEDEVTTQVTSRQKLPQDTQENIDATGNQPVKEPKQAPATPAPETQAVVEPKAQPSGQWTKDMIDGLKQVKAKRGIDNDGLTPFVQEFFGNQDVDFRMLTPQNAMDFIHFMDTKN